MFSSERMWILSRRLLGMTSIGVAVALTSSMNAQQQSPTLYACVQKSSGQMRLVGEAEACRGGESRLEWQRNGVPGAIGPAGQAGPIGAPGARGPAGPAGVAGAQGARGNVGSAGPAGAPGAAGPQGPAGVRGATGAQGPTGSQGAIGVQGPVGPQGPVGAPGATGVQGSVGAQGPMGAQGATGARGTTGAVGAAGAQGPVGAQGAAGPAGPVGAPGSVGAIGPRGQRGVAGAQGPQGVAGVIGPRGTIGAIGMSPSGPKGPTGPQGPPGVNGVLAAPGGIAGTATCASATVEGLTAYVPGRAFMVITGSSGAFQMDRVPAGTYSVVIDRAGAAVATIANVVVGNGVVSLGSVPSCASAPPGSCTSNNQCLTGQVCTNAVCVWPCGQACSGTTPICNVAARRCVQCLVNTDCKVAPFTVCSAGRCTTGGL